MTTATAVPWVVVRQDNGECLLSGFQPSGATPVPLKLSVPFPSSSQALSLLRNNRTRTT